MYEVIWREKDSNKIIWSKTFNTKDNLINFYKDGWCVGIQFELVVKYKNKEYSLRNFIFKQNNYGKELVLYN